MPKICDSRVMSRSSQLVTLVLFVLTCRVSTHTVETFWRVDEEASTVTVYCCTYHPHEEIVARGVTLEHDGGPEGDGALKVRNQRTNVEQVFLFDTHIPYIEMISMEYDGRYACPDYPHDGQQACLVAMVPFATFTNGETYEFIPSERTEVEFPWCEFTATGLGGEPLSGITFEAPAGIPSNVCNQTDAAKCSIYAGCEKNETTGDVTCTCPPTGFVDVHGDGSVCEDINECLEIAECHAEAECDNTPGSFQCSCAAGYVGDGYACSGNAWGVRSVFEVTEISERRALSETQLAQLKHHYAMLVIGHHLAANESMVAGMPISFGQLHYGDSLTEVRLEEADNLITLIALFDNETLAEAAVEFLETRDMLSYWLLLGSVRPIVDGPAMYRWSLDPIQVNPTGLTVDSVYFEPSCLANGCWKVHVTYTAGTDNFNVFFLPKTEGDDGLSFDQSYDVDDATWEVSPEATFEPRNHPCTTADYQASLDPMATPASVTACCIPEFLSMYRPVHSFPEALSAALSTTLSTVCGTGARDRDVPRSSIPIIARRGQDTSPPNVYERPIAPAVEGISGEIFAAEMNGVFVNGAFSGMARSHINSTGVVDAYVGIYEATLSLDEVELRTLAGMLKGTVGIEHTVDTFVGLAEFSPTGQFVLDPFVTQVNIHLEKTSFFSVSTHGTNDYTFLEYVNMRLVAIYNEDDDFSGADESGDRTVRTSSSGQANYVQVTFTLGSQYRINADSDLIPRDSVRAGHGTFFEGATLEQKCSQWSGGAAFDGGSKNEFGERLEQGCAPQSTMCASPDSIDDSFVSFNIPLGIDFFAGDAGGESDTLSNNVFVDMVISAVENTDGVPNDGDDPEQMKTALTASIPIVEGGVNIFCDGFTAKTDLKDVANADIVVGSASNDDELSRLRIKKNIATTQLAPDAVTRIDSDSIEAGLMTLVLKGNASYFETNTGRDQVFIELEDVITIHIMDDSGNGEGSTVDAFVSNLITAGPSDNSDSDGLITDGYALNGAFYFTIDRAAQRAHLEPSPALIERCPYNPPRPAADNVALETCVTRRDVRYREYPWRTGGKSTAMEICAGGVCPSSSASTEADFFVSIFGDSSYAKQLAVDYATTIASAYGLNGRYRRAYWINPGYEWTPTQTGGTPIFSVSQKLYLFALITLDEGIAGVPGQSNPEGAGPNLRRRMLLQSTPEEQLQDGQASVGADAFEFQTSPSSLMASTFNVAQDLVATFAVNLHISHAVACMEGPDLQAAVRDVLDGYLSEAASAIHTVQVTRISVDRAGLQCDRRALRSTRSAMTEATADVTMLVVFKDNTEATLSLDKFLAIPGVQSIEPLLVSPAVNTEAPLTWVRPTEFPTGESGSSSSVALIAGAAGGALLLLALVVCGFVAHHRRRIRAVPCMTVGATLVQPVNIDDLKAQLAAETNV